MIKIGEKKYSTIKEYAKQQGVTIQTIYNWIKDDRVKTKKLLNETLVEV